MAKWREYRVGDVAEIYDGPHATPSKTDAGPWFLSISSLKQGRLDLRESAHVSEEDFQQWTRRVTPQAGDLLFSYETRLGEAALMPDSLRGCLGRRMALMRARHDIVEPRYLLYAYISPEFQETIRQRAVRGATVDRIPLSDLPDWPIRLPDLTTQRQIAIVLGALDDKIAINDHINGVATELRDALLPKLTSGEMSIEDADSV
jgi:type I restriction enzyme S subunit